MPTHGTQMNNVSIDSEARQAGTSTHPALDKETRVMVDTTCAAWHLNRRPQTLRCWAAYENGPLRPARINGRLAWSTAELRHLLGVQE
jgi:hypothetical protein